MTTFQTVRSDLERIQADFPRFLALASLDAKAKGQRTEKPVDGLPGLSVITNDKTGTHTYAFRYRRPGTGQQAKLTIGRVDNKARSSVDPQLGDSMNLIDAARLMERSRELLKQGIDPAGLKAPTGSIERQAVDASDNGPTVDVLFVKFLDWYAGEQVRASTLSQMAGKLGLRDENGTYVPTGNGLLSKWQGRSLAKRDGTPLITKADAYDVLDVMKKTRPVQAKRVRTVIRQFGDWAEDRGFVSVNPFATLKLKYKETPRDRVLTVAEIRSLHAQQDTIYGKGAWLILATGQRPSEVFEATWSEFDLEAREWIIPGSRAKNGVTHLVPLSDAAMAVLETLPQGSGYLFATNRPRPIVSHSNSKRKLFKSAGMPDASYHDLRRTAFNWIDENDDFGLQIAHAVTNHTPDKLSRTYSPQELRKRLSRKQAALNAWGGYLTATVEGRN